MWLKQFTDFQSNEQLYFSNTKCTTGNNLSLFESLYNHLTEEELLDFLVDLKAQSVLYEIKNLKAYLIGSLKHRSEQIFEEKYMKK